MTEKTLTVAVMTHPLRIEAANALRSSAPELDIEVVLDPEPNGPRTALRSFREACRRAPGDAAYHLIVQDDISFCASPRRQIEALLEHAPSGVLGLFADLNSRSSSAVRLAALTGACWAPAPDVFIPTQALLLSREAVTELAAFLEKPDSPDVPDDVAVRQFVQATGRSPLISAPSVVDHRHLPSLMGNDDLGARPSACFLDVVPEGHAWTADVVTPRFMPYLRWHTGEAYVLRPASESAVWELAESADQLARLGTTRRSALDGCDGSSGKTLKNDLGDDLLREIWLAAYLLGRAAVEAGADVAGMRRRLRLPDATLRAALSTFGTGTIRQLRGVAVERRHRDDLHEFVVTAVESGILVSAADLADG